jgi:hypothetical protein
MNEEWRVWMNILCATASIVGLLSGFIAFDAASKWQKLSKCALSKWATTAFLVSTFASCTHAWASISWTMSDVAYFPQWEIEYFTYIASGASVILPCIAFVAIHVVAARLIKDKISQSNKSEARHGFAR